MTESVLLRSVRSCAEVKIKSATKVITLIMCYKYFYSTYHFCFKSYAIYHYIENGSFIIRLVVTIKLFLVRSNNHFTLVLALLRSVRSLLIDLLLTVHLLAPMFCILGSGRYCICHCTACLRDGSG